MGNLKNSIRFAFPYKKRVFEGHNLLQGLSFTKSHTKDLISGKIREGGLEELLELIEKIKVSDEENSAHIFHLTYELGFLFNDLFDELGPNETLGIFLEYDQFLPYEKRKIAEDEVSYSLKSSLSYEEYLSRFKAGQCFLENGDCYQFNLTIPFIYEISKKISFDEAVEKVLESEGHGAYASITEIPTLDKLLIHNSPECLFQIEKREGNFFIQSMPIKGTAKQKGERSLSYQDLALSKKDEAELFMITDLIRNDLSSIEENSSFVRKKKCPLYVPGIVHQYALIEASLSRDTSLLKILKALFPGGSITGAPKKRVIKILKGLEQRQRGFYCGSTLIHSKGLLAASINIRSAEYSPARKELRYQAGGGITLLSDARSEYEEIMLKVRSLLDLLLHKY